MGMLMNAKSNVITERAFVIHIEAFCWKCLQDITPCFTQEESGTYWQVTNT